MSKEAFEEFLKWDTTPPPMVLTREMLEEILKKAEEPHPAHKRMYPDWPVGPDLPVTEGDDDEQE